MCSLTIRSCPSTTTIDPEVDRSRLLRKLFSLLDGIGEPLLGAEREAHAIGDLLVLIPPLCWTPPTPDSVA
jgi:hypothetical protein